MKSGAPVYTEAKPSLADGLAVPQVGANAFATARPCVDHTIVVSGWRGTGGLSLTALSAVHALCYCLVTQLTGIIEYAC